MCDGHGRGSRYDKVPLVLNLEEFDSIPRGPRTRKAHKRLG